MNPAPPKAWFYLYLLIGKRLREHNNGKVYSTKRMLPVELLYYEAHRSKEYVYKREKRLKKYGGSLTKLLSRIGIDRKGGAG